MILRKKIMYAFVVFIFFILVVELVLRGVHFPPSLIFDEVRAKKEAWLETEAWFRSYKFNNLGMRGSRPIHPKRADTYRIVCFGDSWTFGLNVPEEKSYPSFLQGYLNKKRFQEPLEVINAGYPGFTVKEARLFFLKNEDMLTPDCIIFLIGMNGILPWEGTTPEEERFVAFYETKGGRVLARSYFYNALNDAISSLLRCLRDAEVSKTDKRESEELLLFVGVLERLWKHGTKIILLNYPGPKRQGGRIYNFYHGDTAGASEILIEWCRHRISGIPFIDLSQWFQTLQNANRLFLPLYHTHPNEEGYRVIAERVGSLFLKNKDYFVEPHRTKI